jgi:hypothetical protein
LRPLLVLLLALIAAGGLWLATRDRDAVAVGAPELEAPDAPAPVAELDEMKVHTESGSARATVDAPAVAEDAAPQPAAAPEPAPLQAVITLLEHGTERPLAGFDVALSTYGVSDFERRATTDDDGRLAFGVPFTRGKLYLEHVPEAGHERFAEGWTIEPDSWLLDASPGTEVATVVHARAPVARVSVHVVRADGSPAAGAEVRLARGAPVESGWYRWHRNHFVETDANGFAELHVDDPAVFEETAMLLLREPFEGEVSERLPIGPPLLPGPHELRLYRGATADVEVVSEDGAPVAGLEVWMRNQDPLAVSRQPAQRSDEDGRARFEHLVTGTYAIMLIDPATRSLLAQPERELAAGEEALIRVEVPHGTAAAKVVVAGRVLGADGGSPGKRYIAVALDGEKPRTIATEEDGTFRVESATPVEQVTVYGSAAIFSPPIEPEVVTVPAGTTDVVLQLGEEVDEVLALFRIVDAQTRRPLPDEADVALRVYRQPAPGARVTASMAYGIDAGSSEVEFVPVGDVRWHVTAPGYREERGAFDLDAFGGDEPPLIEVALERGFRREIFVLNARTGEPIEGATASVGDQRLGTTAGDGGLVLDLAEWPDWIKLEAPGYMPNSWRAKSHWFFYSQRFWLEPLD